MVITQHQRAAGRAKERGSSEDPPGSRLVSADAGTNQALLDDRDDQLAVLGEDLATSQATGARGVRGVLGVQQPPVGAERAVEPHGVAMPTHLKPSHDLQKQ